MASLSTLSRRMEHGIQLLLDHQIQEGVDDALALLFGDLADGFALQPLIFFQHRLPHPDVVVPVARRGCWPAGRPSTPRLPRAAFCARQDRCRPAVSPRPRAAKWDARSGVPEHLRIAHGEARRVAVRAAQRIGPDARLGGFIDQRHVLLPRLRLAHITAPGCCRPPGGRRPRRERVIRRFSNSAARPPPLWMMPVPSLAQARRRAQKSRSSSAQNAGMCTPCGS